MANPWFRLYAEIRRDPKVRTMPESHQLRLIWLYTLRCDGPTEKLSRDELMFGLSCDETFLETLHYAFQSKGFIENDWSIPNWNKRQYVSDSSTQRVRKYRENRAQKQDETFQKRYETKNETDQNRTEQKNTKAQAPFVLPEWVPQDLWEAWMPVRKAKKAANTTHALEIAIKRLAELKVEGYNPADVLEQSILRGYSGLFPVRDKQPEKKHDPLEGMIFANGRAQ